VRVHSGTAGLGSKRDGFMHLAYMHRPTFLTKVSKRLCEAEHSCVFKTNFGKGGICSWLTAGYRQSAMEEYVPALVRDRRI
jgi:hypothetical protein